MFLTPVFIIAFPNVVVAPATGSAVIGTKSYVITCTVTATPVATSWSWTKTPIGGGTAVTINQGTNTNKYEVANNAASPSLTIKILNLAMKPITCAEPQTQQEHDLVVMPN